VVLGAAEAKFLKPVKVNETVVAQGSVQERQGKKQIVAVKVLKGDETVFQGTFTCFVLEHHVLG
jgi:acyl-coenzyme A thioesterase PaaI-like protein